MAEGRDMGSGRASSADRRRSERQALQHGPPRRIGEGMEQPIEVGFIVRHIPKYQDQRCAARGCHPRVAGRCRREWVPSNAICVEPKGPSNHRASSLTDTLSQRSWAAVAGRSTTTGRIAESFVLSESGKLNGDRLEVLRKALKRGPTNNVAHMALGHVLSNMGELDGATAQFERTPKLPGDQIATWAAML